MIITNLFEAGKPVITNHEFDLQAGTGDQLAQKIRALGAGHALEQVLANPEKMLFRGLRGTSSLIVQQDTLASVRSSENTSNYVTWLTEVLPSWKRANILPRSKIVSCTSSLVKASAYGRCYIALPTDNSSCAYNGAHDFWDAFEGINHVYGNTESVPAINQAFEKQTTKLITSSAAMVKMCKDLADDLESGKVREEDLNPELQALLQSDDSSYDVLEILDNLLDPSHMRTSHNGELLVPGNFQDAGEEVSVGGDIVFVEYNLFMSHFNHNKVEVPAYVYTFILEPQLKEFQTSGLKPVNDLPRIFITNPFDKGTLEKFGALAAKGREDDGDEILCIRVMTRDLTNVTWNDSVPGARRPGDLVSTRNPIPASACAIVGKINWGDLTVTPYEGASS